MPDLSPAQKQYLFRVRRRKISDPCVQDLLFLGFLLLWEVSARRGWIDSFIFSSPSEIWQTFLRMVQDQSRFYTHWHHADGDSGQLCFYCFLGIGTAVLLWCCPKLSRILEPYLVVLNSLPKSALAPLLIVWLGANVRTIIVAGISVAIFGSIINLYTGFREANPEKLKLIRTLGRHKKKRTDKVFVLPSSVPLILSVMKVNIGLCLVGVIIGEFIGARQGLGYLIIYGSQTFKLTWVLMSIVILCVIAMGLYAILNFIEKHAQKW